MLREPQHERKIFNGIDAPPVVYAARRRGGNQRGPVKLVILHREK